MGGAAYAASLVLSHSTYFRLDGEHALDFKVRCAEASDDYPLKRLYGDFICEMNQYDPDDGNMDDEVNHWIVKGTNQIQSIIYVVALEDEIIGFTRLQTKERTDSSNHKIAYVKLSDLFVASKYRKMGAATALVNQAMLWAKEKHGSEMVLNVYEANRRARDFYEKFGFAFNEKISLQRIRMTVRIV